MIAGALKQDPNTQNINLFHPELSSKRYWRGTEIPGGGRRGRLRLLGGSGGVVNSLDFYPASLKSFGRFYFRCILTSQWKALTVNS